MKHRCVACEAVFKETIDPKQELCTPCTDTIKDELAYFNPEKLTAQELYNNILDEGFDI